MEGRFYAQAGEGIIDRESFFILQQEVVWLAGLLKQLLDIVPRSGLAHLNCQVVATFYAQLLDSEYGAKVVNGHFGGINTAKDYKIQYRHSWLVVHCAPQWVIDVAPFNGLPTMPVTVNAQLFPWRGFYRPGVGRRQLTPDQLALTRKLVSVGDKIISELAPVP